MLVLSRKKHESIIIDDRITVTVIEVVGNKVRLGIEAPRDVPVYRPDSRHAVRENAGQVCGT